MEKEYNMTINRLPSKTWNWLRMNETQLEKIEVPTAGGVKVSLPEKITTAENEGSQPWNADFAGIPSGMGEDMDGLLTAAGVKAQHYEVSEETTEAQPLLLDYTYVQNSLQAGAVAVRARKNSEITVIQDFASDREAAGQAAVSTRLHLEEGAKIRLIQIQRLGNGFTFMNDIGALCEEKASLEVIQLILGGKNTYLGCKTTLQGRESSLNADTAYIVGGDGRLDMNYVAVHEGKKTQSNMQAGAFLGLLAPFGWGLLLAYVLDIPTRFFAQKLFGGRRGGAMAVSYALFFGALALLAALIVPQLVQSVTTFAGRLGAYEETIRGLLVWVQNTFGIDTATAEQLVQMVGTALQNWFGGLSRSAARAAADFVSGAAGAAGNAVVALAASIYLLSGKEALLRAARACLHAALPPRAAGSALEICRLANKIFSGYIGGQLVDALLVGGETFALMSIFGLEYAPLLAVLVGVTNIVPVLGPFLGAVPGLIILLLELPWKAAEFAIIIFVVQQVDGNFIAPRILGGATGLPGLGVLLAIVVGGAWFGIPGMVLGVPTLAVLAALLKQAVGARLTARGLDENGEPRRNLPGGLQEN